MLILMAVLLISSALAYFPMGERRQLQVGLGVNAISSGLAILLAWPGFSHVSQFGFAGIWYLDSLAAGLMVLTAVISLATSGMAYGYFTSEFHDRIVSAADLRFYSSLVPIFLASMYAAILSNHLGLTWLALETALLVASLLVAFYRKQSALEAAWKYLLLCSLGMSLCLAGFWLLLSASGQEVLRASLLFSNLRDLAVQGSLNVTLVRWAFVLVFIGLGATLGLVPMHAWLPDAHSKSPSPVSALLSGILLNVILVSLLRVRQIVDLAWPDGVGWTAKFFLVFGCLSVVVPAIIMINQKNYKRLLAYSSIEHLGLMSFSLGLGPAGLIPALMHLPGHALLKSAMFMATGTILGSYKTSQSVGVSWVSRRLPKTATLFMLSLFLLLAAPFSAVFASQLLMIGFGLQTFMWPTLLVVIALTMVFVAMNRHIFAMMFAAGEGAIPPDKLREPWSLTHLVIAGQLLLVLALGIFYLTPAGLQFMIQISQSLTNGLL